MEIKSGPQNTQQTLDLAFQYALEHQISTVVVASTYGDTGLAAITRRPPEISNLIVVSHNTGFSQHSAQQMPPEVQEEIRQGATLYTGTLVLRGLGAAIRKKMTFSEEELVADTLRMFGQGTKVCCEMAAMVSDAGLLKSRNGVFVAGTAKGADTAMHILSAPSNLFFETKIINIIVKPNCF